MRCRQSLARDRAPDAESAPRLAHLRCSLPQEALVRGQQRVLPRGLVDRPASVSVDTAPYRPSLRSPLHGQHLAQDVGALVRDEPAQDLLRSHVGLVVIRLIRFLIDANLGGAHRRSAEQALRVGPDDHIAGGARFPRVVRVIRGRQSRTGIQRPGCSSFSRTPRRPCRSSRS